KIPRFAFEKFPGADPELTTTMKSVGEAMSLGRNFAEALNKAMRSMETSAAGFWTLPDSSSLEETLAALKIPHDGRLYTVERALRLGASVEQVHEASGGIDPWFLDEIKALVDLRSEITDAAVLDEELLRRAKRSGLSDRQLAALRPELAGEDGVRILRHRLGVRPVYKTVDTCAAEFEAKTPYHYSTYDEETEVAPSDRPKVLILGSGPNRIGQGIEFDYSCVHAVMALRAVDYETVMVNCNPETVSTDYDTADRLYFEPLTFEDVLEVFHSEDASGKAAGGPGVVGVIVQLGGQTPLGLAQRLKKAGVPIVGTSPESIDLAEDRGQFGAVLAKAGLRSPDNGTATSFDDARAIADEIGYPVLVRPSYVLGGRGMEIVYDEETLRGYIQRATEISPDHPVLVDRFLDDAIEIDVDALCDATGEVYLGGVMEHIEEAGIHSGDSSCSLPPITLAGSHLAEVRRYTEAIARGVGVRGLLNVQYALKDDALYVLEANPRASRTVPFVSKATAVPLAKAAARIMLGATIASLREEGILLPSGDGGTTPENAPIAIKEAVLPFKRFRTPAGQGVDSLLGPEMKSTGEVMGIDAGFGQAFAKSQAAAYGSLPTGGKIFVSVANRDKRSMIFPIKRLADLGFTIVTTAGTGEVLRRHGIACEIVPKHFESPGRNAVSLIEAGEIAMIINTPQGSGASARSDGYEIRSAAVTADIPSITTVPGAAAAVMGIEALMRGDMTVRPLQELHAALRGKE
ncbi:MAG TPA: carbamoyl-phosphate synthase large subunit, partial [Actinoplanes sp.]